MDALTLLLQLCFTSFVVLLPVVVGVLAFRRLTKSTSSNAWIYAVTCLFAAVTTAGLLPWAVGLNASNWIFFVLAAFCPATWFGVTTICDVSRKRSYEADGEDIPAVLFKAAKRAPPAPLILRKPIVEKPVPVFSHRAPANVDAPSLEKPPVQTSVSLSPVSLNKVASDAAAPASNDDGPQQISEKSVLDVAREMRRNKSTEERRPKLLPAPSIGELAFIKSSSTV